MSDQAALYRTICEKSDDDTPRLVFADWLQEHDDEARAEFIRLQCRRESMDWDDPGYVELKIEEDWQRICRGKQWQPSSDDWGPEVCWVRFPFLSESPNFSRGFPDWARIWPDDEPGSPKRVSEHLSRLLRETPARQVVIEDFPDAVTTEILRLSDFTSFVGLECDPTTDAAAEMIAEGPQFRNLRHLILNGPITDLGLDAFAASSHLPELSDFSLLGSLATPDGLDRFLGSPIAARLQSFTSSLDSAGEFGMYSGEHFRSMASATLPRLRALSWEVYENPTEGFRTLVTNQGLSGLRSLELVGNDFPARDLDRWKTAPVVRPIRLVLEIADVDDECIRAIVGSPLVERLKWLEIRSSRFDGRAMSALANWKGLPQLQRLLLSEGRITAVGLGDLLKRVGPKLGWLSVMVGRGYTTFSSDFDPVLDRLNLPGVRRLCLNGFPIGDRGARAVAENGSLSQLRMLELPDCDIGNEGAEALVESPYLSKVEHLDLERNPISDAVRARLAELPRVVL